MAGDQVPASSDAAADSTRIKRYTLSPIRVIAERPSQSIGAITHKEVGLGDSAAPESLKDVLSGISGISTTVGSKDESNLSIRGFRKNEVKILVDGRPLNSGYFGNVDLNSLPISDVSELMIIKGPASALYGSNSMGGVVNLITREPSTTSWLRIGTQLKRNNTHLLSLQSSRKLEGWDYSLYTSRRHSDGLVLSEDFEPTYVENGGVRNNARQTSYNLQGKLGFELGDFNYISVSSGITYADKKQVPSSVYESKYRLYRDWMRSSATLMGDFELWDWTKLYGMIYYDGAADTYQEYNDSAYQYLTVDSDMKNHTLGVNPRLELDLDKHGILNTGIRLERLETRRKDNGQYPDWTLFAMNLQNIYVQHEYELKPGLSISSSMGLASFDLSNRNEPGLFLEPALGLYHRTTNYSEIGVAIGKNTAFPTMRQLFSSDRGNPNLKAQKAIKYELSYGLPFHLFGKAIGFGTSVFYNDIQDLIDLQDGMYQNIYAVNTFGTEVNLLLMPLRNWNLELAYYYLNNLDSDDYILCESPRNGIEISNSFSLPAEISISHTSSYKDIRYSQDSAFNFRVLHSYWLHNVQMSKRWQSWHVYAGIENILDQNFQLEYGYPAAGINFNLGIELEI